MKKSFLTVLMLLFLSFSAPKPAQAGPILATTGDLIALGSVTGVILILPFVSTAHTFNENAPSLQELWWEIKEINELFVRKEIYSEDYAFEEADEKLLSKLADIQKNYQLEFFEAADVLLTYDKAYLNEFFDTAL